MVCSDFRERFEKVRVFANIGEVRERSIAVGGTERMRRFTMNFTTASFLGGLSVMVVLSLLGDRETYRRGKLRKSFKLMRANPLFSKETWRRLRDYNRADFHPDDHNTDELLDFWRDEMFGAEGRLNDKLVGAA